MRFVRIVVLPAHRSAQSIVLFVEVEFLFWRIDLSRTHCCRCWGTDRSSATAESVFCSSFNQRFGQSVSSKYGRAPTGFRRPAEKLRHLGVGDRDSIGLGTKLPCAFQREWLQIAAG